MATDKAQNIDMRLRVTGSEEAARAFDRTKASMDKMGTGAQATGAQMDKAATSIQSAGQKATVANDNMAKSSGKAQVAVTGLSSGVSALGTVVGSTNPKMNAFAGVVGTAGTAVGSLVSVIGLPGALIGGSLIAAMGFLSKSTDTASDKQAEFASKLSETAAAAEEARKALIALQVVENPEFAGLLGFGAGERAASIKTAVAKRQELAAQLEQRVAERDSGLGPRRARRRQAGLQSEIGSLEFQIQKLTDSIKDLQAVPVAGQRGAGGTTTRTGTPGADFGGAGGRGAGARGGGRLSATDEQARFAEITGDVLAGEEGREIVAIQEEHDRIREIQDETESRRRDSLLEGVKVSNKAEKEKRKLHEETGKQTMLVDRQMEASTKAVGQIMVSSAIMATSALIAGNKAGALAALASIGDQLIASGIMDILNATGLGIFSFGIDPRATAGAGIGAAKIAAGTAMGAAFRGSAGSGGGAANVPAPPVTAPAPARPLDSGGRAETVDDPRPIVINLRSVAGVTAEDGQKVVEAIQLASQRSPSIERQFGKHRA